MLDLFTDNEYIEKLNTLKQRRNQINDWLRKYDFRSDNYCYFVKQYSIGKISIDIWNLTDSESNNEQLVEPSCYAIELHFTNISSRYDNHISEFYVKQMQRMINDYNWIVNEAIALGLIERVEGE